MDSDSPRRAAGGGQPDLSFVLSILSRERARLVCYYLMAEDVSAVNELFLAMEVATWETGVDRSRVSTERVTCILESLRDETLPRLDEAQLIAYDTRNGTVRYDTPSEEFARLLRVCREIDQPR